ncbi:MAG: transporter substrate-binding domain-containing protein, partial [Pseudomonadales bacterium]
AVNRLDAVAKGDVHIECGTTTNTLSRQEIVDFSNLFYMTGANFLTTATSGVGDINDLDGKRIAVVANTTTINVLRKRLAEGMIKAELDIVDNHREAMKRLEKRKVVAVAGDRATLLGLIFASPKRKSLRLTADLLSYEPYAFPVRRNDADYRLVVNRALSDIYLSGQVGRIWEKWFNEFGVRPTRLLLTLYQLNSLSE